MGRTYNWNRNEKIHKEVQRGRSYRDIGREFGMTHTNVMRIFRLHRKKVRVSKS